MSVTYCIAIAMLQKSQLPMGITTEKVMTKVQLHAWIKAPLRLSLLHVKPLLQDSY